MSRAHYDWARSGAFLATFSTWIKLELVLVVIAYCSWLMGQSQSRLTEKTLTVWFSAGCSPEMGLARVRVHWPLVGFSFLLKHIQGNLWPS